MSELPDQTRNLNPILEARIAMLLWGKEYSELQGGSMDFWDRLGKSRKDLCSEVIRLVKRHDAASQPKNQHVL